MRKIDSRLLGFLYGDGWVYYDRHSRNYLVGFSQSKRNLRIREFYKKLLEEHVKRKCREHDEDVYVSDKDLYEVVKELKSNPVQVFSRLSLDEKLRFIEGLIDAEAHVSVNRLRIYNKNKKLLREIKKTFEGLGVRCYLYDEDVSVLEVKGQHFQKLLTYLYPIKSPRCGDPQTRA